MSSKHLFWPDFIRALAIGGIVMIHVSAPWIGRYGQLSPADWWLALGFGALARITLLFFFMLTGFLYLNRRLAPGAFLASRAVKILPPFIFWGLVYDYGHLHPFSLEAFKESLLRILQQNTSGHLWYLYTLIGLYFFMPILAGFVRAADESLVRYYLWLWFTVVALLPLLDMMTEIYPGFDLGMMAGYSGYLLLGYWLPRLKRDSHLRRRAAALYAGGLLVSILAVFVMTQNQGQTNARALGYLTPNIIIMSGSAFYLLRDFILQHEDALRQRFGGPVAVISRASFGIYLVHILFIRILAKLGLTSFNFGPAWLALPTFWALIFLLSLAFTLIWQRLPLLRRLVP